MQTIKKDNKKYHYLYKITRNDGKFYIGMHSTSNLDDGYFGSGKMILRSVKKHGKEKHIKEIIEFFPSRETLRFREKEIITEALRADSLCMNLAPGGGGGFINEEHRLKAQLGGASKGGKAAIANQTPEERKRRALKSAETRRKNNCPPTFSGKKHNEETKRKIGLKNSQMTGERNSQFGKCWITKNDQSKSVKLEELESYISLGYCRGRK